MGKYLNSNRAIFLDRDGVINKVVIKDKKPYPPASLKEFELIDGIENFLDTTKKRGFKNIIVTNQPDYKRGILKKKDIDNIHHFIIEKLSIDQIYVCWDAYDGITNMRKPLPGLLLKAAIDHNIDLKKSYMIGDRWRDIDAGSKAGCKTIFIDYKYDEKLNIAPDYTIFNINEVIKKIF
jgi:D-glycero-D-manno-heptose 1,7-bisphosphate phosphatase